MNLAISNIAWAKEVDNLILQKLLEVNIPYLEIAPTRLIDDPYQTSNDALLEISKSFAERGIKLISMQSILYGKSKPIFENPKSCQMYLLEFENILNFAQKLSIPTLVFGSPSIRNTNNAKEKELAIRFFTELADKAGNYGVHIALEANPTIYGTNFLNSTQEALDFVLFIQHPHLGINLDLGTIIQNQEDLEVLITEKNLEFIKHVHISEPYLALIDQNHKPYHQLLYSKLKALNYQNFISIEMKSGPSMDEILSILKYIKEEVIQLGDLNE